MCRFFYFINKITYNGEVVQIFLGRTLELNVHEQKIMLFLTEHYLLIMPGLFTPPFTCNLKKALPFLYYILSPFFFTYSISFFLHRFLCLFNSLWENYVQRCPLYHRRLRCQNPRWFPHITMVEALHLQRNYRR